MSKTLQFPKQNKKEKSENPRNPYQKSTDNYQIIYSKKYKSHILISHSNEKEFPEYTKQNNLEALVKKIAEEIEEQLEYFPYQNLEETLKKEKQNEKYITPKSYKNNIVYHNFNRKLILPTKSKANNSPNTYPESGASIFYVPSYTLPHGEGWRALGMYDPRTHTIYIANDLTSYEERFVYHHEIAHSLGIEDENLADQYAASKVGYNLREAA